MKRAIVAGRKCAKRPIGLIAAAAIAATAGAPMASAAETELVVIVTPYVTQPPPESQNNVRLPGLGTFSVKQRSANDSTQSSASGQDAMPEARRQR